MKTEILSIGDELLYGHVTDTNAAWLARQLLALGLPASHFQTVGDELPDIVAAFRLAFSRAELIIATGGLGPTDDDLTLEALAQAAGVSLTHREEVMDQMAERLKRSKKELNPGNRKQALLPQGAAVLRNDWGTAPGVHLQPREGQHVFLMPGVPREMEGLFRVRITPYLSEHFGGKRCVLVKHYHSFALPESIVGERLRDLMRAGLNPDVGTRVAGGIVTVRVVASAEDPATAQKLLEPVAARVRAALADHLFGEDEVTLAEAAARALMERRLTVACAESCTAGLVSALLARVPGVSAVLTEGAVVYANEAKTRLCGVRPETLAAHGAVSPETARELAEGLRQRAGTDLAVSVTGIAGPDGGSAEKPVGLVFFGVASATGTQVEERRFLGLDRNTVRERAAHTALDLLRRAAQARPPER
jgi:nicotinamide-nucleotide amidase